MDQVMQSKQVIDRSGVLSRIKSMDKVVAEIGCGPYPKIKNAISIDIVDMPGVDIVADVNNGLGFFEDGVVDEIHSFHFLEHVQDLEFVLSEMYRVLKIGGKIAGSVPHFSNPYYYSDYTHHSPFGLYTFSYFCDNRYFKREVPNFYNSIKFKINYIKLGFASPFRYRNKMKSICQFIFNFNRYFQEFYEENLCYFIPAYEVIFEIEKER